MTSLKSENNTDRSKYWDSWTSQNIGIHGPVRYIGIHGPVKILGSTDRSKYSNSRTDPELEIIF